MNQDLLSRLLKRAKRNEETGCLEWTGSRKSDSGYGHAYDPRVKRTVRVHRLVYELANGPIPKGAYVCHRCDNPSCIEPEHLWLGDASSNMEDKKEKGRAPSQKGSEHGRAKLREEDIERVFALRGQGLSYRKIAKEFDVTENAIRKILKGQAWTHVPRTFTWEFRGGNLVK
jgi:hypothetical protein